MEDAPATVFIVDDDDDLRHSLSWMLENTGQPVEGFASAEAFLDSYDGTRPGCLILDIRMGGMSGLDLQEELISRGHELPILFITGHGDVPMAVRAVRRGALDFIEKPFNRQLLLDRVGDALELDKRNRSQNADRVSVTSRYESLTPREREVLEHVVSGRPSRVIAELLGVSARTIEKHRERLMRKMRAGSTAELTLLAVQCGVTRLGEVERR